MLDLNRKNYLVEQLSCTANSELKAYHCRLDLNIFENILELLKPPSDSFFTENKAHSAFFYCCFPLSLVRDSGLLLPVFFRGDDIEWSWRHRGKAHIFTNGIFVWHQSFKMRGTRLTQYYYVPRNLFLLNCLYDDEGFKGQFAANYTNILEYLLERYDYTAASIFLRMIEDLMKGAALFEENPERQMEELKRLFAAPYREAADFDNMNLSLSFKREIGILKRLLYKFTLKGRFYPVCLMPSKPKWDIALEWEPPIEHFMLVREVKVYNPYMGAYELRRIDKKADAALRKRFKRALHSLVVRFDSLKDGLLSARARLTSPDFWREYLK
jgi:hypothetical protein